jgi:hypothetical protein
VLLHEAQDILLGDSAAAAGAGNLPDVQVVFGDQAGDHGGEADFFNPP